MPTQNQLPKFQFHSLDDDEQRYMDQVSDTVNTLLGANGTIGLRNHLDMGGYQIKNLGEASEETDALSSGGAAGSYAPSVLRPAFEAGGQTPFVSYRQIGSSSQREPTSSYLNDLMSSVPNANHVIPSVVASGGGFDISIPSSPFVFADGSSIKLMARTDAVSAPTSIAISSINSTGDVVTVVTASPSGLAVGSSMTISGAVPSAYNGSYEVASIISSTSFTYQADVGTGYATTTGFLNLNNVYYYAAKKRSSILILVSGSPYSGDTAANRINASYDGSQIVAVVVLTANGVQVSSTGGGGSPLIGSPAGGVFF